MARSFVQRLTLLPPAVLKLDLSKPPSAPAPSVIRAGGPARGPARPGRLVRPGAPVEPEPVPSWWTARATSDVVPGFTRAEILAEAPPDPAAPGGLFERLGGLLSELSTLLVTG